MRDTNSRYKFAPLENGAFFFPTDYDCYYSLDVNEASYKFWNSEKLSSDEKIYELSFSRKSDFPENDTTPLLLEEAVCNTIKHIFCSNILSRGDLSVYYHIWEQQFLESNLYDDWYEDMESILVEYDAFDLVALVNPEDDTKYVTSVFIHKNHPDKHSIIEEFKNSIGYTV